MFPHRETKQERILEIVNVMTSKLPPMTKPIVTSLAGNYIESLNQLPDGAIDELIEKLKDMIAYIEFGCEVYEQD